MKLSLLTEFLESLAPTAYQEDYDNSGLIVGENSDEIHKALVSLDCTEKIVDEAIALGCNLIISHHPIVFKGLKKFNNKTYVERVVQKAIRHNIALYAIHTNLDHVPAGVNGMICQRLGLENPVILAPKKGILKKLITFCPIINAEVVLAAMFGAGAGNIGKYSETSFRGNGVGTFKAGDGANPHVGVKGMVHHEEEVRIEVVFNAQDERKILLALFEAHPYEEVAYDILQLENAANDVGAGMIGRLPMEMEERVFLEHLKRNMQCKVIRHSALRGKTISRVAVCGGSGSFLLPQAVVSGADVLVTADFKYHEFFDADEKIIIADIGHFETEQFTIDLLVKIISEKFSNFAVRKTEQSTNPINYFI